MRTVYWDSGDPEMYFDNPNLRWASPAYLLEPGDPGYVPPLPTTPEPKTKLKRMKHNKYYPLSQGNQIIWLVNFSGKLSAYTAALGLTAGQVTAIVGDCGWLIYLLQTWLPATRTWSLAATDAVTAAQTGVGSSPMVLPVFVAPALPAGVVAVAPGALTRIFTLVQLIKDSGKCTDAIASDLGIVGSEQTEPDLASIQPVISAVVIGSQVMVKWNWGGNRAWLDSCEIQVDRGDGHGYVFLTIDTTPGYTDTQAFPATATRWSYRAIYRSGDNQVGLWSQPASVTVPA